MCIIIWSPSGKIPKDHVLAAMMRHQDGWGFAVAHDGKISAYRSTDYKKFLAAWAGRVAGPVLFHARWATHGAVTNANCHPFKVRGHDLVVAHNGIIPGFGSRKESDTRDFIEKVLEPMPLWFLEEEGIRRAIEGTIGASKLAFLASDGTATILNEHHGVWRRGLWYSNETIFCAARA